MRILVVGASQGTGALVVGEALARGHEVTAFARTPGRLEVDHPKLTKRPGDFHDAASVDAAVQEHDAVVITASATSLKAFEKEPRYFSLGTGYVVDAMNKHGVRRLVVLSALGVGDSLPLLNFVLRKLMVGFVLKRPYEDHERQETMVMKSTLDWVIARPSRLSNGPARHAYLKKTVVEAVPSSISRRDTAHFLVDACELDTWLRKAVQLGG